MYGYDLSHLWPLLRYSDSSTDIVRLSFPPVTIWWGVFLFGSLYLSTNLAIYPHFNVHMICVEDEALFHLGHEIRISFFIWDLVIILIIIKVICFFLFSFCSYMFLGPSTRKGMHFFPHFKVDIVLKLEYLDYGTVLHE